MRRRFVWVIVALVLSHLQLCADEAIRRDGSRISGQLTLIDGGRFSFRSVSGVEPIEQIEIIRFKPKPATVFMALTHEIRLGVGESLVAEVQRLDEKHLYVRTAWHDPLAIPLPAIERVTNIPGSRPLFFDSFAGDLAAWTRTGAPKLTGRKLVFNDNGQSVEAKFGSALSAGKVAVGFELKQGRGRKSLLELGYEQDGMPTTVSVELAGSGEYYSVVSPTPAIRQGKPRREAGRHQMTFEFDADGMNVFVDEFVLWSQRKGPGQLKSIKLSSMGDGENVLAFEHVLVTQPRPAETMRTWADLTNDGIRSPDGDETFGTILSAGPRGITLQLKDKKLERAWPEVAEFSFRRAAVAERMTIGEHVQLRIRTAAGTQDILNGAVKLLGDRSLVLTHPILGELTIPRDQINEIRPLFHGRLIPIDAIPRHLGEKPTFGFAAPKPEGLKFVKKIAIKSPPAKSFVVIEAAHVDPKGTPIEVWVDDELIGELNRLADRVDGKVRVYRLPASTLRDGDNELEIRLRPPKDGGRVKGIDLRAIRLEFHDSR